MRHFRKDSSSSSMPSFKAWSVMLFLLCMSHNTATAQFLPGIDEEDRPQSPGDVQEFRDCIDDTLDMYENRLLGNEVNKIFLQALPDLNACQERGDSVVCSVDMDDFDNNLQAMCDGMNGQYNERVHQVECQASNAAVLRYQVTNYPSCFAESCKPADLERAINREVESVERLFSDALSMPCTVDFEIEDEQGQVAFVNSCPYIESATPEACGPLESATRSIVCDCYTFCNGVLVGCDNVEQVTCEDGDLVAGCTFELFGRYDVEQSASAAAAEASFSLASFASLAFGIAVLRLCGMA